MSEVTTFQPEYMPKEFFLLDLVDFNLTTWLSDRSECLRSVFLIFKSEESDIKETITVGNFNIQVMRSEDGFEITSEDSIDTVLYESIAQCLYLRDGTCIIFIDSKGRNLKGYHFCFEESSEETFKLMTSQ